jgi:histidinol-phosphate aminotransferase
MLAWAANRSSAKLAAIGSKDAVWIDSNENPLGPSASAREAIAAITPEGGRYRTDLSEKLARIFAEQQGLKPEYVQVYAGSTEPLQFAVLAFTSPQRSYVTADPGFEAGQFMSQMSGARVVKTPLTRAYAHDVKAMLAAAPDAGLFYICNPNNPTGTLTSHADVEYLLEHKPKEAVVMVDEAYIHFADTDSALDLVKAGKNVIVLRTFSKIYGMAGLRCGFAIARPDLIERLGHFGGNFMPITAMVAATASLNDGSLATERKRINTRVRQQTFDWLDRNGYSYIPSHSNCFMLDVKRPAKAVIDAMAKQNIFIGRIWPVMPTYTRITVGTQAEMERFQAVLKRVMEGTAAG